jgi:hypothetical protein
VTRAHHRTDDADLGRWRRDHRTPHAAAVWRS